MRQKFLFFVESISFYFHIPLLSVCWVWSDLIWHNCVDSHPGPYHKYPEVEHPGSADSLHSKLQVSQVSGTERYKNCVGLNEWPQRAPTDCLQWFTGATGVVYSYNHAGGQVSFKRYSRLIPLLVVLVVMVDLKYYWTAYTMYLHTMLPVHQLARLHELHPNWGRLLWDRVEGEEWHV